MPPLMKYIQKKVVNSLKYKDQSINLPTQTDWKRSPIRSLPLKTYESIKELQEGPLLVFIVISVHLGINAVSEEISNWVLIVPVTVYILAFYWKSKYKVDSNAILYKSGVFKSVYKRVDIKDIERADFQSNWLQNTLALNTYKVYCAGSDQPALIIRDMCDLNNGWLNSLSRLKKNNDKPTMNRIILACTIAPWGTLFMPALILIFLALCAISGDIILPTEVFTDQEKVDVFQEMDFIFLSSALFFFVTLIFAFIGLARFTIYVERIYGFTNTIKNSVIMASSGLVNNRRWSIQIQDISHIKFVQNFLTKSSSSGRVDIIGSTSDIEKDSTEKYLPIATQSEFADLCKDCGLHVDNSIFKRKDFCFKRFVFELFSLLTNTLISISFIYMLFNDKFRASFYSVLTPNITEASTLLLLLVTLISYRRSKHTFLTQYQNTVYFGQPSWFNIVNGCNIEIIGSMAMSQLPLETKTCTLTISISRKSYTLRFIPVDQASITINLFDTAQRQNKNVQ